MVLNVQEVFKANAGWAKPQAAARASAHVRTLRSFLQKRPLIIDSESSLNDARPSSELRRIRMADRLIRHARPISHPQPAACTHRQSYRLMRPAHNSFTLPHPSCPTPSARVEWTEHAPFWQATHTGWCDNGGWNQAWIKFIYTAASLPLLQLRAVVTVIFGLARI